MEFNPKVSYYQCGICGHISQVVRVATDSDGAILIDEETEEVIYELDGDATVELVIKHEEEAHGIKG